MGITYAQATNTITINDYLEGAAVDFADLYTAETGATNGRELLSTTAFDETSTLSLDSQPKPLDDNAVPMKIVIANSVGLGAGDTCDLAGTDAWSGAISESIVIAAGDGTYTSVERYLTIDAAGVTFTDVAGGGFDGDIDVYQDRWGAWEQIDTYTYKLHAKVLIGNGDETWIDEISKTLIIADGVATGNYDHIIKLDDDEARLRFGDVLTEADKTTQNPVTIFSEEQSQSIYIISHALNGSQLYLYGTIIHHHKTTTKVGVINGGNKTGACKLWNCYGYRVQYANFNKSDQEIVNCTSLVVPYAFSNLAVTLEQARAIGAGAGASIWVGGQLTYTIPDLYVRGHNQLLSTAATFDDPGVAYLIDTDTDIETVTFNAGSTGAMYRQWTVNIHVVDRWGNDLEDVVIECEDQNGTAAWTAGTVSTDANGDITEQTINWKKHYYSGGQATDTYTPHKFTLTKPGYETLTFENVTVDAPVVWHLELQDLQKRGYSNRYMK